MKKLLLLACLLSAGCTINNNSPTTDGGTPGSDGDQSNTMDSGTPGDDSTPGTDGGTDGGSTTETGGGGGMANSCSTGTLFAGSPLYDGTPSDRPASGTGILADPPFQWENLVFVDNWLFSRDTGELWGVDLSASAPVEKRLAGKNRNDAYYDFGAGPCATAKFSRIEGIAALPDKSLVVADSLANAILHVTNPSTSACTVEYWAGNHTAYTAGDPFMELPNQGDVDGPGASAKLATPGAIVTDDSGNVYFFDQDNHKIKKVANDAAHTVSTIVKVPSSEAPDRIFNLTRIGNKIYGAGMDGANGYVVALDLATGTLTNLVAGRGEVFQPADTSATPYISGITTDGTGLIVSGSGYIWYVTTDGNVKQIAGTGPNIDNFPTGYDPKASHAAMDLALPSRRTPTGVGSFDYITYHAGAVYFRGHADGTASFIEKIACP